MCVAGIIDMVTSFGWDRNRPTEWSLADLLAVLARHEVDRAYTHSWRAVQYAGPEGNDETLRACEEHEVLRPVAVLDPRRYFDCREEARRRVRQGFRVFRFFPDVQGWSVEALPFRKICATLGELGAAAIVPAGASGQPTRIAERTADLGLNMLLIGGGYSTIGEILALLEDFPHVYTDGHVMDSPFAIEAIIEFGGEHRPIFGSNSPDRAFEAPLLVAQHAEISDAQRAKYLRGNALAFLGEDA